MKHYRDRLYKVLQEFDEARTLASGEPPRNVPGSVSQISPQPKRPFVEFTLDNDRVVLVNSYNVTSLTDTGRGEFTVSLGGEDVPDNYAVMPMGKTRRDFHVRAVSQHGFAIKFDLKPNETEPKYIGLMTAWKGLS